MAVVVEPQRLLGLFLFGIIKLSIIGKELRGYLIALFLYLLISTISDTIISGILGVFRRKFSNCPRLSVGFFILQKN